VKEGKIEKDEPGWDEVAMRKFPLLLAKLTTNRREREKNE
jgi:hypothetical protein